MRNTQKFAAIAIVASAFVTSTASAAYLSYTDSVTLSNPSAGGTVTQAGTDASFQTADVGNDGFFNQIQLQHRDSTAANNAGVGTSIVFGKDFVIPYEETVVEDVSFDFTYTLNVSQYADSAKLIPTGTGTATITGHVTSHLGNFGATTTGTFTPATQFFTVGGNTYKLSNFNFGVGDADNSGAIGAFVQAVPEPASLSALAVASTLLGRRRRSI